MTGQTVTHGAAALAAPQDAKWRRTAGKEPTPVFDPGPEVAERHVVPGFAGDRAGVAADAAALVDYESVLHAGCRAGGHHSEGGSRFYNGQRHAAPGALAVARLQGRPGAPLPEAEFPEGGLHRDARSGIFRRHLRPRQARFGWSAPLPIDREPLSGSRSPFVCAWGLAPFTSGAPPEQRVK
jgi:hypothetical protein